MENPSPLIYDRTLDEMLEILSKTHCRAILWYFQLSSVEVATTSHLSKIIARQEATEVNQISTQLRHSTLPRLEDAGVIDYDPRSNTVRYLGHPDLEALLNAIQECQSVQNERVTTD